MFLDQSVFIQQTTVGPRKKIILNNRGTIITNHNLKIPRLEAFRRFELELNGPR